MYAPERHQAILEQARTNGRVDVRELAELLEVTPETIRRDLTSLERRGLVRRAHGGAIPVERITITRAVSDRNEILADEKMAIATAALEELPDGGSIIIDAGTTTIKLAELLPLDRQLTVVTHSIAVAIALADRENIELHVLGGTVRSSSRAAVGTWTHQMVSMVSVDVAFLSVNGITPEPFESRPNADHELAAYVMTRMRQTHDPWHVLTGYTADIRGEILLQAFTYAQIGSPSALLITILGAVRHGRGWEGQMKAIREAFSRGKKTRFLPTFRWEEHWATPVSSLRERLAA